MPGIREIATRFTVEGYRQFRTTTTRVGTVVADTMRRAGDSVKHFASTSVRHIGTVTKAVAGLTFKGLIAGSKLAFLGIGTAAAASATKIGLISLAAKKATDEMAEYLRKLDTLSKQTGESVGEIATLRYAAGQNGGDPDELLPTLGTVADQFGEIRKSIEDADAAYSKTGDWARRGLIGAIRAGDANAASEIISAASAARTGSLTGIADRQAGIYREIQATRRGGAAWNRGVNAGMSERDVEAYMSRRRLSLVAEYKSLDEAKNKIEDGFGPVGQALRELEDVGLDMDAALKGGVDTLYALADALEKIPDSNRKLGIAQQLFGEDAGAKNLALLDGGRAAIDRYRREMEDYGALPTKEDAARGTSLKRSEGRRDMAFQGVKLEVNRGLSPLMEETNDQLAAWLSRNRDMIANTVKNTFIAVRTVFYDVLRFLEGNTDYESAIFKKGAAILAWSRKMIVAVKTIASTTFAEIGKILSGMDSNWEWLNRVRDAFLLIKSFATDAFAVISGRKAVDFTWMNDLRAGVLEFFKHLKEAWGYFRTVLDGIHAAIKPVLNLFGTDILTAALFVGMLRFSGILGGILAMGRGLLGVFTPALAGIGGAAAAAAGQIALIGATLLAAWKTGEWIGEKLAEPIKQRANRTQETIAATMRLKDQAYLENKFAGMSAEQKRRYQKMLGYGYYTGKLASEQREEDIATFNKGGYTIIRPDGSEPTDDDKARSVRMWRDYNERNTGKVFKVNLSYSGRSATLFGQGDDAFVSELERSSRAGGNY